jgi:hypothetical protein
MIEKDAVDLKEVYKELKKHYPNSFEKLYTSQEQKLVYSNPVRLTSVAVTREHVPEFTFVCLARDRETRRIEEYYVSQPYNVNAASDFVEDSTIAYFVFRFVAKANVSVLHSFAEESARTYVSTRYSVEELYFRARRNCEAGTVWSIENCAFAAYYEYFMDIRCSQARKLTRTTILYAV